MKIQTCINCVNDTTVKKIEFDNNGICNFCNSYETIKDKIHDYKHLEELFLKRINKEKGKHKYDVALGISGGKDSTYVLYKLVNVYKLKVKAYTLNNGFLSDEAINKINSLVKELNVEHEYVVCDEKLLKKMYHYIVGKYISPCIACAYLGYTVMINYASKVDAAVGMHGRSIPQMFRNYLTDFTDPFKPFIDAGLKDPSEVDLQNLYETSLSKISSHIDKKLAKQIEDTLLIDAKENGYKDFIAYFLYHPYEKNEVIDFISKHTSWKVETEEEHFDCLIHNGAMYLKNLIARRPHLMNEISVMVRENSITRDDAIKELKKESIPYPEKEINLLCKYARLNKKWLITKAKIYALRWW